MVFTLLTGPPPPAPPHGGGRKASGAGAARCDRRHQGSGAGVELSACGARLLSRSCAWRTRRPSAVPPAGIFGQMWKA